MARRSESRKADSKENGEDYRKQFEQLMDEVKKMQELYLALILQTNAKIMDRISQMEADIARNSNDIGKCIR